MRYFSSIAVAAVIGLMPAAAMAVPVYGTAVGAADLTGSRSFPGGGLDAVIFNGGATPSAGLSWVITNNGNGTLHYSYSFNSSSQQGLSHFILDLSDDCTAVGSCFSNLAIGTGSSDSQEFGTFSAVLQGNSNPFMPNPITGIKLDEASSVAGLFAFSFDSNRIPVWGDFYAKGGNPGGANNPNGYAAWDLGLANHASEDTGLFIAVPDSVVCTDCNPDEIPEPSSLALLAAGLLGLGFFSWLRRRQSA